MLDSIASLTITELLRPRLHGEQVNTTVTQAVREPSPDYEAMRRLVDNSRAMPSSLHVRSDNTAE